jgi:DNA-binding CsgD family transcriptional regulator
MKAVTLQEKKIIELIGLGYSTIQMAETLSVSPHTIESHRKNLLVKFDAKNSAELILKAVKANVIAVS